MSLTELVKSKPIKLGAQGNAVRQLQAMLAQLGYSLKGDGYFGGATDTAVADFQKLHGLSADGIVGVRTAAAIDTAVAAVAAAPSAAAVAPVNTNQVMRPLWVTEALKWLNTKEAPGDADNPQILEWAREEGGSIARDYTHDSIPWCALFANMVLAKVGLKGTGTLLALDFVKWGVPVASPAVGAFAPMKRTGGGHIAIVVGRDQHGNLMCVGGNQGDEVSIRPFPASRPVGYRFPEGASLPGTVGFSTLPLVRSDGQLSAKEA
jgi:uncharacterized protein (TIGR02594 family)